MAGWASSTYGSDLAIGTQMPRPQDVGNNWRKQIGGQQKQIWTAIFFVWDVAFFQKLELSCLKIPWEVLYINCFFAMPTSLMVNGWYLQQQLWPKTRSISTWSWGEVQTCWGWKAGRQFAGKKEGVYVEIWVSIAIYSLTLAIKPPPKVYILATSSWPKKQPFY